MNEREEEAIEGGTRVPFGLCCNRQRKYWLRGKAARGPGKRPRQSRSRGRKLSNAQYLSFPALCRRLCV